MRTITYCGIGTGIIFILASIYRWGGNQYYDPSNLTFGVLIGLASLFASYLFERVAKLSIKFDELQLDMEATQKLINEVDMRLVEK